MSNKPVTREFYDSLVIAYREQPGNASYAARAASCERRMAKRGWELGWPRLPWARPIKVVLEAEIVSAQAANRTAVIRAQEAAEGEREAARQESIEARRQEQQMLKAARGDVIAALVLAADLVGAMRAAVAAIKQGLAFGPAGEPPVISPGAAMALLTRHATLVQKAVGAAEAVIQLSRLDRGASTINVGLGLPEENLSPAQIDEELAAIAEVLGAARAGAQLPEGTH
jgi:hypothetical protein